MLHFLNNKAKIFILYTLYKQGKNYGTIFKFYQRSKEKLQQI